MPPSKRSKKSSDATIQPASKPAMKKAKVTKKAIKAVSKTYPKTIPAGILKSFREIPPEKIDFSSAKVPSKNVKGELAFDDYPEFRPTMSPKEVLHAGSFGGTYFRPIKSSVTRNSYTGVWKELPSDWTSGLDIKRQVASSTYHEDVNTYGVKCGGSLEMWEESGWMHPQDPYGWFQWYCRFYQGRRTEDDERQIGRWLRCAGVTGRWRNNLITKIARSGCGIDNKAISPVVRQTLQHWAYKLSKEDYNAYVKKKKL